MRVREARTRLRLELVAREVLRLERERLGEVALEVGGALAGDPVEEIEADVVESGITKSVHGAPDVVGPARAARAPRAGAAGSSARRSTHDRRRFRDRSAASSPVSPSPDSPRPSPRPQRAARRAAARARPAPVNVGVPPPTKTVSSSERAAHAPARARRAARSTYAPCSLGAADDGDEVAVAAAVRAERQMHVEVRARRHVTATRQRRSPSRLSTARNASCGTSTPPTCFMRFLPFFCFSSSFRLRVMSPP